MKRVTGDEERRTERKSERERESSGLELTSIIRQSE